MIGFSSNWGVIIIFSEGFFKDMCSLNLISNSSAVKFVWPLKGYVLAESISGAVVSLSPPVSGLICAHPLIKIDIRIKVYFNFLHSVDIHLRNQ